MGQTAKASTPHETRQWDELSFFDALEKRTGTEEAASVRRILEWARAKGLKAVWGKGKFDGSYTPELDHGGIRHKFVRFYTYGSVEILFEYLCYQQPFDDESLRLKLWRRMNGIPGASLSADKITKRPTIHLRLLKDDAAMEQFLEALDWIVEAIRAS